MHSLRVIHDLTLWLRRTHTLARYLVWLILWPYIWSRDTNKQTFTIATYVTWYKMCCFLHIFSFWNIWILNSVLRRNCPPIFNFGLLWEELSIKKLQKIISIDRRRSHLFWMDSSWVIWIFNFVLRRNCPSKNSKKLFLSIAEGPIRFGWIVSELFEFLTLGSGGTVHQKIPKNYLYRSPKVPFDLDE